MNLKIYLITFSISLLCFAALAQGVNNLIPPSPNAAALLKYTQIPVSKYTGLPNISVPIYTVKSGSLTLPISLSYHASGIKAQEEASWVGLGWALNSGGVISRSIRGKDDFGGSFTGYPGSINFDEFWNNQWIFTSPCYEIGDQNALRDAFKGNIDTEPDLFYYNFGSYSGKFYIPKQNLSSNTVAVDLDQKSNLKIEVFYNEKRFVITDGSGVKYYFGTKEFSYSISKEMLTNYEDLQVDETGCEDLKKIDAWYLDKIEAPTGDHIDFTYSVPSDACSGVEGPTYVSENYTGKLNNLNGGYDFSNVTYQDHRFNASKTVTQEVLLQSISFNNGHIDFDASVRTDVNTHGNYGSGKLDNINIWQTGDTNPLKTIRFYYSYFNEDTSPDFERLKLDRVYVDETPYRFYYDETTNLPSKRTTSLDHWGYYNGAGNGTLIPKTMFGTEDIIYKNGGDREANPQVVTGGMLNKIVYPTGGTSTFEFELNDFPGNAPIYGDLVSYSADANQQFYPNIPNSTYTEKDFYISSPTAVSFGGSVVSGMSCDPSSDGGPEQGRPYAVLLPLDYQGQVKYNSIEQYSPQECIGFAAFAGCVNGTYNTNYQKTVTLQPGWYRIATGADFNNMAASAGASYRPIIGYRYNIQGGGLRVKRITAETAGTSPQVVKYIYRQEDNPDHTSGILMTVPDYKFFTDVPNMRPGDDPYYTGYYLCLQSSSTLPLSSAAQGAFVGYSTVTELNGENGENGKIVSTFMNGNFASVHNVPPVETVFNGELLTESTYTATGSLLKKVENNYVEYMPSEKHLIGTAFESIPPLYSVPHDISYWGQDSCIPEDDLPAAFKVTSYDIACQWWRLANTKTTTYNNGVPIEEYVAYDYNPSNKLVSRETHNLSDNNKLTKKYKYSVDYSSSADPVFTGMVNNHQINEPVEVQVWRTNGNTENLVSSNVNQYKSYANKFIKNYRNYKLLTAAPLSPTVVGEQSSSSGPFNNLFFNQNYFDENSEYDYDDFGNIVKIINEKQKVATCKWSYNHEYPVAYCQNCNDFYYTGFEDATEDPSATIATASSSAHTGKRYSVNQNVSWPFKAGYVISYWYRNAGKWSYSGEVPYVNNNSSGTYSMIAAEAYDDIRIYPKEGSMTTYTYDPLVGMTSATDAKGQAIFYEYDQFQRLSEIKDKDGNIVKYFNYHYIPVDPIVYYNKEQSDYFTKNDCGAGYKGSTMVYIVPEKTYTSTISKDDANNKAINDLTTNGQSYVNAHGTCMVTPQTIYARVEIDNINTTTTGETVDDNSSTTTGDVYIRFYSDANFSQPLVLTTNVDFNLDNSYQTSSSSAPGHTSDYHYTYTGLAGNSEIYLSNFSLAGQSSYTDSMGMLYFNSYRNTFSLLNNGTLYTPGTTVGEY